MASVNLSIRKNPKGTAKILLNFNYGRKKRFRYSTKFTLSDARQWDKRNRKVKISDQIPNADEINDELISLLNYAEKLASSYLSREEHLNNDIIKRDLDKFYDRNKVNVSKNTGLIDYFDWYIDYYSKHPRPKTNSVYGKGTLKTLKSSKKRIEEFQKHYGFIEFNDVNLDLHSELFKFLRDTKEYSLNYTGVVIKNLIVIMNDAYERDFHQNLDFKKSGFTVTREDVDNVYLNESEIDTIKNLNIDDVSLDINNHPEIFNKHDTPPTKDALIRVKDWFIIGCKTGLRYGDLSSLTSKNIETEYDKNTEENFQIIKVETNKTKGLVLIPISKDVHQILEKNKGEFPKKISSQKFNKFIKLICKEAKIVEEFEGKPKYLSVASHTCRRSFCTNAYKSGMDTLDIMHISGHKSEKTFYKYIKASSKDRLNKIRHQKFFE